LDIPQLDDFVAGLSKRRFMICKKCQQKVNGLHRNGPKGISVDFVCFDCLDEKYKPDKERLEFLKDLGIEINTNQKPGDNFR